jgi:putative thioredoxin
LEVLTPPAPKPTAAKEPASKVQITGHSAAPAGNPVVDAYRRKLSMALF